MPHASPAAVCWGSLRKKRKRGFPSSAFADEMRNRTGAHVDSISQAVSLCRYLELHVHIGIKQRESWGIVASVSCTPHQVQHCSMKTTRLRFGLSLWLRSEIQTFGYSHRSLLTTNSKNWRHRLLCVTEQKRGVLRCSSLWYKGAQVASVVLFKVTIPLALSAG